MGTYQIVTDSTADLTPELIRQLDVQVIPLCYMMGGRTYHNIPGGGEMTDREFYAKLRGGAMSTTTQINSEEFLRVFTPLLEAGQDVLYIAFSSGLSGTCQSAQLAREELQKRFPQRKMVVFDSLCASMGEGLLVYYAAKLRQEGKSLEEVLAWLQENVLRLCHWFTVDDLNHLKRGGRVSTATALVGTMLGIKPVLHVDTRFQGAGAQAVLGRFSQAHGGDRPGARRPDGVHQPRRLPGGRPLCRAPGAGEAGRAAGGGGLHRPCYRRPFRAGHRGPVFPGEGTLTPQGANGKTNEPCGDFTFPWLVFS